MSFHGFFLYRLTLDLFKNKTFAIATVFAYSISPASIFTLAIYTEPVFAMFTFVGLYFLFVWNDTVTSTVMFIFSAMCRSNGIANAFFIFYTTMEKTWKVIKAFRSCLSCSLGVICILVLGGVECIMITCPMMLFEEYAFNTYCKPSYVGAVLPSSPPPPLFPFPLKNLSASTSFSSSTNFVNISLPALPYRLFRRTMLVLHVWDVVAPYLPDWLVGGHVSVESTVASHVLPLQIDTSTHGYKDLTFNKPWCDVNRTDLTGSSGGSVYGYVQKKYWNVGFLNYYVLKQLGQHFLSLPIIALSLCALATFWRAKAQEDKRAQVLKATPFVVSLGILLFFIPIIHIQVLTRFLNSTPVLFWFYAYIFLLALPALPPAPALAPAASACASAASSCASAAPAPPTAPAPAPVPAPVVVPRSAKLAAVLLMVYCVGYSGVGCVLFPTFMNWT